MASWADLLELSPIEVRRQAIILCSAIVPMIVAAGMWVWRPPDRATQGSIALATTWNAVWLLMFNVAAVELGWWSFVGAGPEIVGVPVMLWFGWTLLWGTAGAQSPARAAITLLVFAAFDLLIMPLMGDVVVLGRYWLVGEVVLLGFVAWPGLALARWTKYQSHLRERVLAQVTMFAAVLLWFIPVLSVTFTNRSLALDIPTWSYGAALFSLGCAALPALSSVHDFYLNGGTPWPWDSTSRPVKVGAYRYVRSPMQASGTLVLMSLAAIYSEPVIFGAALSNVLYGRLFCQLEKRKLSQQFGATWSDLALKQRRWIPHWRPSDLSDPATVWIDLNCKTCSPIASFLLSRDVVNLEIEDASDCGAELKRLRYERSDGTQFDGVAGVGACLEHINLAWAMVGWLLRLPVIWRAWQLIGDAVGLGPRTTSQRPVQAAARTSGGKC